MKKLVMLSALFHIGLVVLLTLFSMAFSLRRFEPQVYHVDLVEPSLFEKKVVREKPASDKPPEKKDGGKKEADSPRG